MAAAGGAGSAGKKRVEREIVVESHDFGVRAPSKTSVPLRPMVGPRGEKLTMEEIYRDCFYCEGDMATCPCIDHKTMQRCKQQLSDAVGHGCSNLRQNFRRAAFQKEIEDTFTLEKDENLLEDAIELDDDAEGAAAAV
jgi:hypothetical protein